MYYGEQHVWGPLIRKIHKVRENNRNSKGGKGEGGNFMWAEPKQLKQEQSNKWTGWYSNK
jgi:hypothetical protein